MIHQLIFTKLLGELDYGAGTGIGDFNAAGCAASSAPAEPRGSRCALENHQGATAGPGQDVCAEAAAEEAENESRRRTGRGLHAMEALGRAAFRAGPLAAHRAGPRRRWLTGVLVGVQLQRCGRLDLEHPRLRLDLPGAPATRSPQHMAPAVHWQSCLCC